ncbi:MAG: hypothetical protein LW817_03790 [Candidatus Caenarcaniphilales bacterium]|jgi:hypothetical protein|nr:hypothetical protein [Candidatus Caenarcaniphilales bacterium]
MQRNSSIDNVTTSYIHKANQKHVSTDIWDKAKIWAKIFDSRPSTYRAVMDLVGADIPTVIGGMRNIYSFIESLVEASASFIMVFAAPKITSLVSGIIGKLTLDQEHHDDIPNHLLFHRQELHDLESYKRAIDRINVEEVEDKAHVASLYQELNNSKQAKKQEQILDSIKNFCEKFKANNNDNELDSQRRKILNFKEKVQLAESTIEGAIWGSFGITMRLFRKYVLRQNSFTGTVAYTSAKQRTKLGDDSKMGFKEYLGAFVGMGISPILNYLVLNATRDRVKVKQNKFLNFLDQQFDMNHGLYPRLGMMFSFMVIPKWSSVFLTAQGRNELIEKFSKAISMIPLWWLGQKITNGPLAAMRDKQIQTKYGTEPGVLVDKPRSLFPEANKYYEVFKKIQKISDPKIREDIFNQHAKTVYQGLGLHTFLIFSAIIGSQYLTKLRVQKAIKG